MHPHYMSLPYGWAGWAQMLLCHREFHAYMNLSRTLSRRNRYLEMHSLVVFHCNMSTLFPRDAMHDCLWNYIAVCGDIVVDSVFVEGWSFLIAVRLVRAVWWCQDSLVMSSGGYSDFFFSPCLLQTLLKLWGIVIFYKSRLFKCWNSNNNTDL